MVTRTHIDPSSKCSSILNWVRIFDQDRCQLAHKRLDENSSQSEPSRLLLRCKSTGHYNFLQSSASQSKINQSKAENRPCFLLYTNTRPTTRKHKVYHFISKLHKRPFCLCSRSRQAHIPRLKSKNGVICGKIPTVENFATKKQSLKNKKCRKKKGRLASGSALTPFFRLCFQFVSCSFSACFLFILSVGSSLGRVLGSPSVVRALVSAKHTPENYFLIEFLIVLC